MFHFRTSIAHDTDMWGTAVLQLRVSRAFSSAGDNI